MLTQLAAVRQANSHTYGTVMSMHAQLGDAAGLQRLLQRMETAGVVPDAKTCMTVAKNCEEGGLGQLSELFRQRAKRLEAQVRGGRAGAGAAGAAGPAGAAGGRRSAGSSGSAEGTGAYLARKQLWAKRTAGKR